MSFSGPFDDPARQQSDSLGVVEQDAPLEPVARDHRSDRQQELLGFGGSEVHAGLRRVMSEVCHIGLVVQRFL